jgi:putative hydrolase of the HAD superfamily
MNCRAVIFDIYSTLLEVGPPPADAETLWQRLFAELLNCEPPLSRTRFSVATAQVVARLHAEARARGIPWPEVQWPAVVREVIPDLARLPADRHEEFHVRLMAPGRTLRLMDGAAECLRWLHGKGVLLGLASNAQAYTVRELDAALAGAGINRSLFDPKLCFWSFEHGFSKPDPHVFRILTARLEARGIRSGEILMVGDRLDNDIEPGRAQGWQTWHLQPGTPGGGGFRELRAALA